MVGVVLNLAVWFALHTLFGEVHVITAGPVRLQLPALSTLDGAALEGDAEVRRCEPSHIVSPRRVEDAPLPKREHHQLRLVAPAAGVGRIGVRGRQDGDVRAWSAQVGVEFVRAVHPCQRQALHDRMVGRAHRHQERETFSVTARVAWCRV